MSTITGTPSRPNAPVTVEDAPAVSIGVPVFNGAEYLEDALESLRAQTYQDFEVVICDNASTDDTEAICRRFVERDARFRYFRNDENLGAAKNFNLTFEHSRGGYFKWFAHDDRLAPEYLERCVGVLDAAPDSGVMCFPRVRYIDFRGREISDQRILEMKGVRDDDSYSELSFRRLTRLDPAVYPMFAFGLARTAAIGKTRLIGGYVMSDLIVVGELRLVGEFREVPEKLFHQRVYQREPSRVSRSWKQGEAVWFDPANENRRVMPYTRVTLEYFKAIGNLGKGLGGKLTGYLVLLDFIIRVVGRVLRRRLWMGWSVVSAALTRSASVTSVPLRLWCLVAGLARRDGELLRLACSAPRLTTPLALMIFGTERLTYRFDPYSVGLLLDWLDCAGERRQVAAAVSVVRAPNRYRTYHRLLRAEPDGPDFDELLAPIARRGVGPDSGLDDERRGRLGRYLDALEARSD